MTYEELQIKLFSELVKAPLGWWTDVSKDEFIVNRATEFIIGAIKVGRYDMIHKKFSITMGLSSSGLSCITINILFEDSLRQFYHAFMIEKNNISCSPEIPFIEKDWKSYLNLNKGSKTFIECGFK